MEKKFYNCYSINQMRFLINNKVNPVHVGQHDVTGRMYWVFEINEKLSNLLTEWSKRGKGSNSIAV